MATDAKPSRWQRLTGAVGKALDDVVLAVSPQRAVKRASARRLAVVQARRLSRAERADDEREESRKPPHSYFRSAETDGMTGSDWMTSEMTLDGAQALDQRDLVERSRLADDTDAYFGGGVDKVEILTIGDGLRPQARIKAVKGVISESAAKDLNAELESLFEDWSEFAGVDGSAFEELQSLGFRHGIADGNGIAVMSNESSADAIVPLAVEVIDPTRLETPPGKENKTSIRLGVECTPKGKPIRYWFRNAPRGDLHVVGEKYSPVDAWKVCHVFGRKRAGQTIGLPWGHRVLDRFKALENLEDATMTGAQTEACFAAFIETPDPYGDMEAEATLGPDGRLLEDVIPGKIIRTRPGEKVSFAQPGRPGNTFGPFAEHQLRAGGAGLDFPYEYLAGDWSKGSYVTLRLAMLSANLLVRRQRRTMERRFCKPIWRRFVEESVIVGASSLSGRMFNANRAAFTRCTWFGPSLEWLDPVKEVTAILLRIKGNLSTYRRELEKLGIDLDELIAERAAEKKAMDEAGIEPEPLPGSGSLKQPNGGVDGEARRSHRDEFVEHVLAEVLTKAVREEVTA